MLETTFTQSLLDRYIEEEKALQERQQSLAALTVHMDANDLAMLNTIAKRFNKNRSEIAEELLASALIDFFTRFEAGERKLIARDADEMARNLANDIAEDNGIKDIDVKAGVWANQDRQTTRLERKLAKQQAEAETTDADAEIELEAENETESELETTIAAEQAASNDEDSNETSSAASATH